ncbi:MAG: HAD-IA family hydrolase [candidate division KSB1 bacterium]|nr:HAD-IA family hydrolase [candidate division KSB1 bacterium]MDZ7304577.1 HAD-IA family hydrolase [candidate division KSB1 bacterium]MDZ7313628.1 HAD-IA family hydrolase [candidate division KSB1 bacterium]
MPNHRCEVDLLIFDLDGTLADTRRDLANAVNHALQKIGKNEITLETITGYVGDGMRKLLERALGETSDADFEMARQHFQHFYAEHLADYSHLYPGVREVLKYFANKKKAVLSNKPQEFTEVLLQRLEIRHHFELVVGGQANLQLKPDPEAAIHILKSLHVSPKRSVIIGDGENDIRTGKAAGIMTCAVTYGFRTEQELSALEPDFVVNNLAELKLLFI